MAKKTVKKTGKSINIDAPQPPYPGYLTPQQQLALATQAANSGLLPQIQAANQQIAQAKTDARNAALAQQEAYNAVGDLQAKEPDQIQQTYDTAANSQASFAKGFSDAFASNVNQSADQANQVLARNNSAQSVTPASGQSDVLFGLGGYSPASVLNQEGAAFKTEALNHAAQAAGLGHEGYQQQMATGAANVKTLQQQLANVNAQRPSLIQQALSGVQSQQSNAQANWIQNQYLNNTIRNTTAGITGVDPVTGQPTFDANKAHQAAIDKRDTATSTALSTGRTWLEKQLKPGTQPTQIGDVPIKLYTSQAVKDSKGKVVVAAAPVYEKQGGGTTRNPQEAATKPIYAQEPVPKPQFNRMWTQLTAQLKGKLARYGYKQSVLKSMAYDILDDYYTTTTNTPAAPGKTRTGTNQSGGTTTTYGP